MESYSRKEKLRINVYNETDGTEHFHQDIELLYILEGTMEVTVGEQITQLKQEDILVINANRMHILKASKDILFVMLTIEYELVSDIFQSMDIIFWCDSTRDESERFEELRNTLKQLLKHYISTHEGVMNFGHIALCYQVLDILSVHFLVQITDKESMEDQDKFEHRLSRINHYIRMNFNQPISLKLLSEQLYLSNGYLSRFFKKAYGMSFAEYLTNVRLYHAMEELLYTNKPITRIAYDNGFSSIAIFNRTFKKAYEKTPSSVREKSKKHVNEKERNKDTIKDAKQIQQTVGIHERLKHFLRDDGIEPEKHPETGRMLVTHSATDATMVQPIWNQVINIGEAEELLQAEVQAHISLLREKMGFKYVRIWNLFSEKLFINIADASGHYNFNLLDQILDFLIALDIKPHIELGQKPKRINKNVQSYIVCNNAMATFDSIDQWKQVLDALMKHLVKRYGRQEIGKWKMELWYNEQDQGGEIALDAYFELFNLTCEVIRNYSDCLEVGGCGIRTEYTVYLKKEFLSKWMSQKYKPDFISVMNFAYIRGIEDLDFYSKRSTDAACLLHGIQSVKADLLAAGIPEMKVVVSEWNLTISDRNFINDTCFKGAYIIKNMLDVYGEILDLAYFSASDCASVYNDVDTLLFGGMGLLTKDGIMKPAGYAYEFMNRMYDYYVGKGTHHLVTTDLQNNYGIVCHNMKNLNYNYYFTKEDEIEKEHIWKYYEDRNAIMIKIVLADLENGLYQLKTYRINEQSGSVLNMWQDTGFETDLSGADVAYFKNACVPKLSIQRMEIKNYTAEIEISLSANEIALLRLLKLE